MMYMEGAIAESSRIAVFGPTHTNCTVAGYHNRVGTGIRKRHLAVVPVNRGAQDARNTDLARRCAM